MPDRALPSGALGPVKATLCVALVTFGCLGSPVGADDPASVRDSSLIFLEIVRLEGPTNIALRLWTNGLLERWDASYLTVYRTGSARLSEEVTATLFELASSVPLEKRMGDGSQEGDIYSLFDGRTGAAALYLEPLAPDPMHRLIARMLEHAERIDMHRNARHFIRAEIVDARRVERLRASRVRVFSSEAFTNEQQKLIGSANNNPFQFVPVSVADFARLADLGQERTFFVSFDGSSWFEVSLWSPP